MAPIRVAINGFGRIGRLAAREIVGQDDLQLVHINDVCAVESAAYLLKYDSVHGIWAGEAKVHGEGLLLTLGETAIPVSYSAERSPVQVDWAAMSVDIVLEASGKFLTRKALQPYFDSKVAKVVVAAPVKDPDPVLNIVMGCNEKEYDSKKDHIVTAASCTTNCLAPIVKVIHEKLGIVHGCITTVHNVTNTQTIVDAPNAKKDDLRRARSGLVNLAPTSTGSATAIALIFPELKGKLNGLAVRVPLINSSITDCVFEVKQHTNAEHVNSLLQEAADTYLGGILGYEMQPLVSTDYINDRRSSIVDALSTQVIDNSMVKIYAWYDNEMGYACRYVDVVRLVASSLG
ncbi:hypothetical protein WJX73_001408 [Symbiochloris irregularis]|uniref:Glyceraldehyde-3-phosphate dehydrogenase n=1 Tax=Symbiochloris irregularis TaxID=706552 RepID=A0AAW1NS72_9CHLO